MSFFGFSDNLVELPNLRNTQVETYFVTVPPAELPISLALVKEHLKLSLLDNTQDQYLTLLIKASSDFFEKYTNRTLINTTFITYYDKFRQSFELFKSKLQTVESFEYSSDGSLVSVDPSIYYVTQEDTYSRIIIPYITNFPKNVDDIYQAISVEFIAGYGETQDDIPSDIQLALLNQIAYMYENRGDCDFCGCSDLQMLPINVQNIYNQYRILSAFGSPFRG